MSLRIMRKHMQILQTFRAPIIGELYPLVLTSMYSDSGYFVSGTTFSTDKIGNINRHLREWCILRTI